jgi:hypothetical protein
MLNKDDWPGNFVFKTTTLPDSGTLITSIEYVAATNGDLCCCGNPHCIVSGGRLMEGVKMADETLRIDGSGDANILNAEPSPELRISGNIVYNPDTHVGINIVPDPLSAADIEKWTIKIGPPLVAWTCDECGENGGPPEVAIVGDGRLKFLEKDKAAHLSCYIDRCVQRALERLAR